MELTELEKRFVEEYCTPSNKGNKAKAARKAGYSEKSAADIGYQNYRKAHIRAAIDAILVESAHTKGETLNDISEIARNDLKAYFVIRKTLTNRKVKKPLSLVIVDLETAITMEDLYAEKVALTEEAYDAHLERQEQRRHEIIRHEITLQFNPKAFVIDTETEERQVAELDLVKLIKDQESGKIKSFSIGEFGPKIEMYAADTALYNLARIHGLFEKDNEQVKPEATIINNFSLKKRAPDPPTE